MANQQYKAYNDRHRSFKSFKEGELMMIHLSKERYMYKLKVNKIGLFPITIMRIIELFEE